jgi:hypothetical protein
MMRQIAKKRLNIAKAKQALSFSPTLMQCRYRACGLIARPL